MHSLRHIKGDLVFWRKQAKTHHSKGIRITRFDLTILSNPHTLMLDLGLGLGHGVVHRGASVRPPGSAGRASCVSRISELSKKEVAIYLPEAMPFSGAISISFHRNRFGEGPPRAARVRPVVSVRRARRATLVQTHTCRIYTVRPPGENA